jgi:hypothetical protein
MRFVDQFVHGWDLARAIGHDTDLERRSGSGINFLGVTG